MDNQNQSVQIIEQENNAFYLMQKAEVDSAIATAKAFPRSITKFQQTALSIATSNEEVAESCTYALPRAGKKIEGASVRLAEIVVAAYGNIRAGAMIISNDGKTITARGTCHDLENNVAAQVEVKRRITDKHGKTFNEDMQTVAGNAACAIAYRNAVYKVIPTALINIIWEETKKVARGTAATLVSRRDKAVDYFKSIGVTDKQLCEALEIEKLGDIDLDKLEALTGMRSAIKNGETTVKDLFEKQVVDIEDLKELFDLKKDSLTAEEKTHCERIIKNKEENSYSKLLKVLKSK